jgi:hypothetical protein
MLRGTTVLAHLASTFKAKPEVVATSALWYILWRSAAVWQSLLALVGEAGVPLPDDLDLREQAAVKDLGRPDLAATASDGTAPLLIELKFGAGLTANQPANYLRQLPEGQPGALLFVVPKERVAQVWDELAASCAGAGLALSAVRGLSDGAKAGATNPHHRLVLVSWEDLLHRLQKEAERASEPGVVSDLVQIRGLYAMVSEDTLTPFESGELSPSVPRALHRLLYLVDRLRDRMVNTPGSALHGRFSSSKVKRQHTRWGHEFKLHGMSVYLHVDIYKWLWFERSPMWLSLYPTTKEEADRVWDALGNGQSETLFEDPQDNASAVALMIPVGKGQDDVLADLELQLLRICEGVDPSHAGVESAPAPTGEAHLPGTP